MNAPTEEIEELQQRNNTLTAKKGEMVMAAKSKARSNKDDLYLDIVNDLKEKNDKLPQRIDKSQKPSIWRVPSDFRHLDLEAYEPKIIFIDPLHHEKKGAAALGRSQTRVSELLCE